MLSAPGNTLVDTGGEFTKTHILPSESAAQHQGFQAVLDNSPPVSLLGLPLVAMTAQRRLG
jgi:hypothetical protein